MSGSRNDPLLTVLYASPSLVLLRRLFFLVNSLWLSHKGLEPTTCNESCLLLTNRVKCYIKTNLGSLRTRVFWPFCRCTSLVYAEVCTDRCSKWMYSSQIFHHLAQMISLTPCWCYTLKKCPVIIEALSSEVSSHPTPKSSTPSSSYIYENKFRIHIKLYQLSVRFFSSQYYPFHIRCLK